MLTRGLKPSCTAWRVSEKAPEISACDATTAAPVATTTVLFGVVAYRLWHWPLWKVVIVEGVFIAVDLAFFGANLAKIPDGGWFPLVVAALVYILMSSWKKGRVRLAEIVRENTLPLELFLDDLARRTPPRVPGTAVFLTSVPGGAPPVLLHHLKHNKVLHETVVLMSVLSEEIPQVDDERRVECRELGQGFYQVLARYGFMETPDVPAALAALAQPDAPGKPLTFKALDTTYYLGRETLIASRTAARPAPDAVVPGERMARWRKRLFILMTRNAQPATAFFNLPANRVVELGAQLQF